MPVELPRVKTLHLLTIACAIAAPLSPAWAADAGWSFLVQPYLMLPAMDGSAAVRGFDANVDVGRQDVISNLNIGFLGYAEASNGTVAIGIDVNYVNLDANPDDSRTSANVTQTVVQPMLFYKVADKFELLAGLRYNKVKLGLESDIPAIDGAERSKDWVDPILGFRFAAPIGGNNSFSVLANVGGFGIGSDLAIQVKPMLSFGISTNATIDVGYQIVYMDYESGSGADRFVYDVLTDGPVIGVSFRF